MSKVRIQFLGLSLFVRPTGSSEVHVIHPDDDGHHDPADPASHGAGHHADPHIVKLIYSKAYGPSGTADCDFDSFQISKSLVSIVDGKGGALGGGAKFSATELFHFFHERKQRVKKDVVDTSASSFKSTPKQAQVVLTSGRLVEWFPGAVWEVPTGIQRIAPSVTWECESPTSNISVVVIGDTNRTFDFRADSNDQIQFTIACAPVSHFNPGAPLPPPPVPGDISAHIVILEKLMTQFGDPLDWPRYLSGSPGSPSPYLPHAGCTQMKSFAAPRGVDPFNCIVGAGCPEDEPDCD